MSNPVLKTCPKTSKTFPKPFPRRPPLPPTLCHFRDYSPKIRPSVEFFSFFIDFWHTSKIIKKSQSSKHCQLPQKSDPDRPKVDFGMTFAVHLGIDFHEIFDFVIICENHQNAFKQSISVGSAHPKSYIFSLNFD